MIKITRYAGGFNLRFSDRGSGMRPFDVPAADGDEVKNAIDHYYLSGGHVAGEMPESCPLCRRVVKNERRHRV